MLCLALDIPEEARRSPLTASPQCWIVGNAAHGLLWPFRATHMAWPPECTMGRLQYSARFTCLASFEDARPKLGVRPSRVAYVFTVRYV